MKPRRVYWAGDLFNFKDLLGNRMLSEAFDRCAGGSWEAVLPQDNEANSDRSTGIRDSDLEMLLTCDALVANFDGSDLDSGTVVEFCFSKFLDMPSVLLRTDFRRSGDSSVPGADPWNLMCSSYPRTETLCIHSLLELSRMSASEFLDSLAVRILEKLEKSAAQPMISGAEELAAAYRRVVQCTGGSMVERFPAERVRQIVAGRLNG